MILATNTNARTINVYQNSDGFCVGEPREYGEYEGLEIFHLDKISSPLHTLDKIFEYARVLSHLPNGKLNHIQSMIKLQAYLEVHTSY